MSGLLPYVRRHITVIVFNVLSASLNKQFPSFRYRDTNPPTTARPYPLGYGGRAGGGGEGGVVPQRISLTNV